AVLSRALGSKVGFLFQPPPKSGVGIRDMRICFSVVVFEARDSFRIQWVVQLGNVFSCPGSHGRVGLISIQTKTVPSRARRGEICSLVCSELVCSGPAPGNTPCSHWREHGVTSTGNRCSFAG